MNEQRQSPVPPWVRRWWSLPVFLALIGWEFYSARETGTPPNWIWLGVALAGLAFLVLVNLGNMRR
ncbi:MAG: hypothetical protein KF754_09250 [Planctomycetes bacterium]|nr:hypothetical protein [Planctomycetota bacterium]